MAPKNLSTGTGTGSNVQPRPTQQKAPIIGSQTLSPGVQFPVPPRAPKVLTGEDYKAYMALYTAYLECCNSISKSVVKVSYARVAAPAAPSVARPPQGPAEPAPKAPAPKGKAGRPKGASKPADAAPPTDPSVGDPKTPGKTGAASKGAKKAPHGVPRRKVRRLANQIAEIATGVRRPMCTSEQSEAHSARVKVISPALRRYPEKVVDELLHMLALRPGKRDEQGRYPSVESVAAGAQVRALTPVMRLIKEAPHAIALQMFMAKQWLKLEKSLPQKERGKLREGSPIGNR